MKYRFIVYVMELYHSITKINLLNIQLNKFIE